MTIRICNESYSYPYLCLIFARNTWPQGRGSLNVLFSSTLTPFIVQSMLRSALNPIWVWFLAAWPLTCRRNMWVSHHLLGAIVAWRWQKELCQSFMPEEFSFCCSQSYWCYGWCLQLEKSNCRCEGKLGPMSKQTISYNLYSWVQARRGCEDMQQESLRAYPEKAHGSKLPGSHWY